MPCYSYSKATALIVTVAALTTINFYINRLFVSLGAGADLIDAVGANGSAAILAAKVFGLNIK